MNIFSTTRSCLIALLVLVFQATAHAATGDASALLARLATKLTEHYQAEGQIKLEVTRPLIVPETPYEISLIEAPASLASLLIVRVRITPVNGGASVEHSLALRAQLIQEAWASRSPIERDQAIDIAQLESRRIDTLRDRDAILVSADLNGFSYARAVSSARMLNWSDLTRRILIRKGQLVEITATDGQLVVTMKALALENASADSTVKVRNLESRKDFTAYVIAENRAQVRF